MMNAEMQKMPICRALQMGIFCMVDLAVFPSHLAVVGTNGTLSGWDGNGLTGGDSSDSVLPTK